VPPTAGLVPVTLRQLRSIINVANRDVIEAQIAKLEDQIRELLTPGSLELADRLALFQEFNAVDAGHDRTDSAAVETRLAEFFASRAMVEPPSIFDLQRQLDSKKVELAALTSAPYAALIQIARSELVGGSDEGKRILRPDLSVSSALFLQSDFGPPWVAFDATLWGSDMGHPEDIGMVSVTFSRASPLPLWGVSLAKFGYPNEEAFDRNPTMLPGFRGIGFYEIVNGEWASEIVQFNRPAFPDTPDDLGLRHFLLTFKENTLEVLAADFKVERLEPGPIIEAIAAYLKAAP
jgi:hypothetical protein